MNKFSYRADIDGLRAIAVILVILYHAFPNFLTGGFVGVDVFFVISGYLITGIISQQISDNEFSLRQFYSRRIVRLFPTLIAVLITVMFLGWGYLLSSEYRQLGKHVHSGFLFWSNFRLLGESGYFDVAAETKPLLHLWSLAIEEQFYIVWPIILIFLMKIFNKRAVILSVLLLISLSFGLCLYYTNMAPSKAFYLPLSRFWEIGFGAFLALILDAFPKSGSEKKVLQKTLSCLSISGVLIIIFSAIIYVKPLPFPGWRALLPVLGTVLVILGRRSFVNKLLLGNSVLVGIGLLSYPLYLWHWPFLAFGHILYPLEVPLNYTLGALFASVVLSYFSYITLERWAKKAYRIKANKTVLILFFMLFVVGHVGKGIANGLVVNPLSDDVEKVLMAASDGWGFPGSQQTEITVNPSFTVYSQGTGEKVVLFLGDSNVQQYQPRVARLFENSAMDGYTVIFATRFSCPPMIGVSDIGGFGCFKFGQDLESYVKSLTKKKPLHAVVFGAQWAAYLVEDNKTYSTEETKENNNQKEAAIKLYSSLQKTLRFFENRSKKKYLIFNIPIDTSLHPLKTLERSFFKGRNINKVTVEHQTQMIASFQKTFLEFNNRLRDNLKDVGQINFLDPTEAFKINGEYRAFSENQEPFYRDCCHVRPFFIRENAKFLDVIFNETDTGNDEN